MNILGKRIKSLRSEKNIKQKDLAEKVGVSNVVLSRYESGERNPDYETLVRIANNLDVTTDYLLGIESNLDTLPPFEDFIDDEDLIRWYKELPKDGEENLRRLRRIYEAYKED